MFRELLNDFRSWHASTGRKSLLLRGARQVGKTWFVRDACEQLNIPMIELNFERDPRLKDCFDNSRDPRKILDTLEIYLNQRIGQRTLVFFDEIQACPDAYVSLKFFTDSDLTQPIVAAGSHLGILEQMTEVSHPVGYVDELHLYPMSFFEYARAGGLDDQLLKYALNPSLGTPKVAHAKLMELYVDYLFVGGLPECVKTWVGSEKKIDRIDAVRSLQNTLLDVYKADFAKYHGRDALGLVATWEAIARQLNLTHGGETKRFRFKEVIAGKKEFSQFRNHFQRLEASGLIYRCPVINSGQYPLKAHQKDSLFKAYYFDTGIMLCELNFEYQALQKNRDISYKGFITENFVMSQLVLSHRRVYCYQTKSAEVEFMIQQDGEVVPIEVKNNNLKAKSLQNFIKQHQTTKALKVSQHPYYQDEVVQNLPLYTVATI